MRTKETIDIPNASPVRRTGLLSFTANLKNPSTFLTPFRRLRLTAAA